MDKFFVHKELQEKLRATNCERLQELNEIWIDSEYCPSCDLKMESEIISNICSREMVAGKFVGDAIVVGYFVEHICVCGIKFIEVIKASVV